MMLKIFTLAAVVAVCASATTGPTTTSTEAPDVLEPDVDVVAEAMTLMMTACATEIGACATDASCGALLQTVQAEERLPTTAEVAAAGFQAGMLFQCYMAAESASENPPPATSAPVATPTAPPVAAPTAPPVAAPTAPPAGSGDDASSAAVTTASCAVAAATAAAMFL